MEKIDQKILIKDFILNKDIIIYNLKLMKCIKDNNLSIKANKKNSIYNYIFSKEITIEYFQTLNSNFQNLKKIDSIIDLLLDIINSKSIEIKEVNYDSLVLSIKYKSSQEFKLVLEKENNTIDEQKLINNPCLYYKETVLYSNDSCGISDIFEIFTDFDNNKILASPNKETHKIDLYDINNKNNLIKSLKGHNYYITFIKFFNDGIKGKKYLMSIDNNKLVIIWDIKNNYTKKRLTLHYKGAIYSALLLFNLYDEDYIITSSYNLLEHSKIYSMNKNNFVKNIYNTDNNYTRYIIPWERKNYEGFYIIELCDGEISIINLFENEIYGKLKSEENDEKYFNGFLFYKNKTEYLCSGGWNGNIYIWNLNELILENNIETCNVCGVGYLIHWSENIIIGTNSNRGLIIVDLTCLKVVSYLENIHDKGIVCIKKLAHDTYGESLFIASNDGIIELWATRSINNGLLTKLKI